MSLTFGHKIVDISFNAKLGVKSVKNNNAKAINEALYVKTCNWRLMMAKASTGVRTYPVDQDVDRTGSDIDCCPELAQFAYN